VRRVYGISVGGLRGQEAVAAQESIQGYGERRSWRMERSRRRLIGASLLFSVAAVSVLIAALGCLEVAADSRTRWFVVCKYEDLDRDGNWASFDSDPPLNGWTFTLEGPPGPPEQKTTSGDAGCAVFDKEVLSFEDYIICEDLKTGWVNSDPGGGKVCKSYSVLPDYIGPIEVLFGNYRMPVGGETGPTSRLTLLAPWLGLAALVLIVAGAAAATRMRRAGAA
jgi:hypothetical protein